MSPLVLLLLLLVTAYFGSLLLGGRALRGYGLPSGCEWLVLGFVLGPSVLGVAARAALTVFEPIAGIAMAWLALVLGTEYGFTGDRRVRPRGFLLGIASALVTAACVACAVYLVCVSWVGLQAMDAMRVGAGVGLASCETARYAVRWAAARSGAQGPLSDLLEDMADTDEIVPLLGVGVLLAFAPSPSAVVGIAPMQWLGITLAIGLLLGLLCALLIRGLHRVSDAWGVLVGAALLGTGIAWRLGLSPLSAMFMLGVTLSLTSRHAPSLRRLLARTEPAFLLPTLLLAGAMVHLDTRRPMILLVVAALVVRALVRTLLGRVVAAIAGAPAEMRGPFSLGMWSTGALTTLVALSFALRFPGELGDVVLASAFGMAVVGEVVGPLALLRAFSLGPCATPEPTPAATPGQPAEGAT